MSIIWWQLFTTHTMRSVFRWQAWRRNVRLSFYYWHLEWIIGDDCNTNIFAYCELKYKIGKQKRHVYKFKRKHKCLCFQENGTYLTFIIFGIFIVLSKYYLFCRNSDVLFSIWCSCVYLPLKARKLYNNNKNK